MTKFGQSLQTKSFEKSRKRRFKFKKIPIYILLAIIVLSALFVYLLQVNTIAAKGFQVRDLEKKIQEMKDSNEKLDFKMIEMQSMGELDQKIGELGMEAVDEITYFDVVGSVVARK